MMYTLYMYYKYIVPLYMYFNVQWLESEFLEYLLQWEKSVKEQSDLQVKEQNKLMLSRETKEGLKIISIIESMQVIT